MRPGDRNALLSRLLLSVGLLLSACGPLVPAQVPAQLQTPAGTYVVFEAQTITTAAYRFNYPAGWRIVKTSLAQDPLEVVLVSPDERLLIRVGENPVLGSSDDTNLISLRDEARLDSGTLHFLGEGPADAEAELSAILAQIRDSVRLA